MPFLFILAHSARPDNIFLNLSSQISGVRELPLGPQAVEEVDSDRLAAILVSKILIMIKWITMNRTDDYYEYEDKIAISKLKLMSEPQTFKMGLELSELALRILYSSFQNQYKNYSKKTALNKFRLFLREI